MGLLRSLWDAAPGIVASGTAGGASPLFVQLACEILPSCLEAAYRVLDEHRLADDVERKAVALRAAAGRERDADVEAIRQVLREA